MKDAWISNFQSIVVHRNRNCASGDGKIPMANGICDCLTGSSEWVKGLLIANHFPGNHVSRNWNMIP
ncbi:MAG TPA: hypothetical protein PLF96_14060 [Thermotogota bacterium]|nr:hypothetical protein [Thermotogota bacterium]